MPRGKRLNSTGKKIICNVYDYFDEQSKKTKIKTGWRLVKKTVEATKFSERTVNRVLLEKRKLSKAQFTSPQKRYKVTKGRIQKRSGLH